MNACTLYTKKKHQNVHAILCLKFHVSIPTPKIKFITGETISFIIGTYIRYYFDINLLIGKFIFEVT